MGSDWNSVSIDEIKSPEKYSCVGGPFGSSLSQKHYSDSGVPVIRGVNLSGDMFTESDFVFVSQEKAKELHRNMAFRGDIVFTQRGTLGQVAIIPEDSKYEQYIVSQSQMKLTVDPKIADSYFIYSYFRTRESKSLIEKNAIVGGVPHINLGILKAFQLNLPPLAIQKRISEISKTIDNKITLNRQINQTLEQMAQTLFKSWFVDFDPVIDNALDAGFFDQGKAIPDELQARAEQRRALRHAANKANQQHSTSANPAAGDGLASPYQPLPDDIRQLFPNAFEESELGWVPKGWAVNSISSLIKLIGGGTPKTSEESYWEGEIPWFSVVDAPSDSDVFVLDTEKKVTEKGVNNSSTKILRSGTTIISARGTVGKCALVSTPMAMNQSCYGVIGSDGVHDYFVYYLLRHLVKQLQQRGHGSVFNTITRDTFSSLKLAHGDVTLTQLFGDVITPWFNKILANNQQKISLERLRDTLLPKLISGELRLDEVESTIAETTAA
ncbi:restriction endonuclease subunit S [Vibrio sp. MEBiC08052]|uniref:restriction endonuclease subunit S n=1 Tax=Vibrio sp. MEBiC08052 TaxID=1761910 RepID=UPI0007407598|nr:restriction endonuclease subunit S [Vibrio sp. MEBiC08052]KUI97381.1 hypothetical protein VRK_35700 [Vibrio sp. MEBiC08052]